MRLKRYLTEARDTTKGKGVTWEEINDIYAKLKRLIRPDMTDQITLNKWKDEEWWDLQFRAYDFYTPRPGEEDDDWPDFTGYKKLIKMISPVLKGIGFSVEDSEKSWFSINVKKKKPTKKELKADAKKQLLPVIQTLNRFTADTWDKYTKEMYQDTIHLLKKKVKTKTIKKEKFFEVAKAANWRWDDDDLENFWRDVK
jgi:hypothetical protein